MIPTQRGPFDDDPEVAKIAAQDAAAAAWPYGSLEAMTERPAGPSDPMTVSYPTDAGRYRTPAQPLVVHYEQPRHATYVEPPNHVLHGLLTIATGGVWGVVWAWRVRKYRKAMRKANR